MGRGHFFWQAETCPAAVKLADGPGEHVLAQRPQHRRFIFPMRRCCRWSGRNWPGVAGAWLIGFATMMPEISRHAQQSGAKNSFRRFAPTK